MVLNETFRININDGVFGYDFKNPISLFYGNIPHLQHDVMHILVLDSRHPSRGRTQKRDIRLAAPDGMHELLCDGLSFLARPLGLGIFHDKFYDM